MKNRAYEMIRDLVRRGPTVRCQRTGRYEHISDMNPNGQGGYVLKTHDVFVDDFGREGRSKYKRGKGWWRGFQ